VVTAHRKTEKTPRGPRFKINDALPCDANYVIVDKKLGHPKEARPIGDGSAGLTYRAKYKGVLERAIKFLSPSPQGDQQAQLDLPILRKGFKREIKLLAELTHENICKIVDFGEAEINGVRYDYYVTEYIGGDRFDDYLSKCSGPEFLDVLLQALNALEYLHINSAFHMDVKEENIFVQLKHGAKPHVILLDLGGAKVIPSDPSLMEAATIYISSEKATRPDRRGKLSHPVTYSQIWNWNVDLDLYAVGALGDRALSNESLEEKLANYLTPSGLTGMKWIIKKLMDGFSDDPIEQRYYQSSTQLAEDIKRLLPGYTWPIGLPELSIVVSPTSIQLPKNRVGLTAELLQVVNHPLFQRLRNIPQLEYVSLIYPGATHSRFEHCLSTFHTARTFLSKLLEDPKFRMIASPSYVRAALLTALLHDIGHYPLSHAFEDFCEDVAAHEVTSNYQILPDYMLFDSFVCPQKEDPFGEIIQHITSQQSIGGTLDELLHELFPDSCELLTQLIHLQHGATSPITTLHGLINSAIDVDKVTYLSDDSFGTGLPFGQGIDLHGLIDALIPPRGDDAMRAAVALKEDGLAAAESIILSRFWMIARAYWHRTNRAVMAMHKFIIAHLIKEKTFDFQRYFTETLFTSQPSATKLLASWYDESVTNHPIDPGTRNPLLGLADSGRAIYKRLLTISNGPQQKGTDYQLYEKIIKEPPTAVLSLGEELRQFLASKFPGLCLMYGDVLIDAPYKPRDRLGIHVLVYLDRMPNMAMELTGRDSVSPMLRNLQEDFEQNVKKCRIFVHPDIVQEFSRLRKLESVRDAVREFLEGKYNVSHLGA
jgi:HD superfamily phosphohydrolase/tRNA A-37 threonylcarbamoyl transferase component Bud32